MIFSIGGGAGAYRGHTLALIPESSIKLDKEIRNQGFEFSSHRFRLHLPIASLSAILPQAQADFLRFQWQTWNPNHQGTPSLGGLHVWEGGMSLERQPRKLENPKHVALKEKRHQLSLA